MGDRGSPLRLRLDGVQGTFYVIKITFPRLNPPYSAGFAENSLLPNTERHHIIDNGDSSIYIVLSITSRRRGEEDLGDA